MLFAQSAVPLRLDRAVPSPTFLPKRGGNPPQPAHRGQPHSHPSASTASQPGPQGQQEAHRQHGGKNHGLHLGHHHYGHHGHHGGHHHQGHHHGQHHDTDQHGDPVGKGAISLLQEFVQCSTQFLAPQRRPILQWGFDTRMADYTTLEFRAAAAFVLDGVPHHVAGVWHPSKKVAQRDAAERALVFFIGCWGEALLRMEKQGCDAPVREFEASGSEASSGTPPELRALDDFCLKAHMCGGARPKWRLRWDGEQCCALVEVSLLGVAHKFSGVPSCGEDFAYADTARRVLWYLRCPGFEDAFEPDPCALSVTAHDIPAPPTNWASETSEEDALHVAERKTALMRVQNRLQKAFARQLRPGQRVWEWSCETDGDDSSWPPLCRAMVHIPVAERRFTGEWVRGQRDAQIAASRKVTDFLDGRGDSPSAEGHVSE